MRERAALPVRSSGNAGFHFGNGAIDYLNGAGAMATLVVLRSLEGGSGFTQMPKRSAHVGLIGPNGLKPQAGNQNHENDTGS